MMTDKATVEMESPVAGKVLELAGEVGDQIPIGSVLVVIETEGERSRRGRDGRRAARTSEDEAPARRRQPRSDGRVERRQERGRSRPDRREAESAALRRAAEPDDAAATCVGFEPAARLRRQNGAKAHGPRLSRRRAARPRPRHRPAPGQASQATASATPISTPICSTAAATVSARAAPARQDETVKVVGLRRKIAENMAEAKRRIPHFTLVEEYDVTALEQTRAMMNARPRRQPEAHPAPLPDHRDGADARRLPADQRHL